MLRILFAGEGGQGVQVAAQILAQAAFDAGKKVLYIPNFGVEQRGGVSLAFLVVDKKQPHYPKFDKADVLAIFSERSLARVKEYINEKTKVILTPAVSKKPELSKEVFRIDRQFSPRVWNVLVLGKTVALTGLVKKKVLQQAMEKRFARWFAKNPELKKLDFEALESVL